MRIRKCQINSILYASYLSDIPESAILCCSESAGNKKEPIKPKFKPAVLNTQHVKFVSIIPPSIKSK